ncbi:MAG: hypothetical protein AAGK78_04215, partial [Planctomycetota bacterium]
MNFANQPVSHHTAHSTSHRDMIQSLETRRLLSAATASVVAEAAGPTNELAAFAAPRASTEFGYNGAPTLIAVADQDGFGGLTSRSISYYDVTSVDEAAALAADDDPSNDIALFDNTPLFTVWTGFEITADTVSGGPENYEEINAFDVNPINGDTYVLAFDSGDTGVVDAVGDGEADYDLYRFNIGLIYNDFITNKRPAGAMYAPQIAPDGFDYFTALGNTNVPAVDGASTIGVPDGRSNTDADPTNDFIVLPGASEKIAEIARIGPGTPFFNNQEISFVDAETLVLMENTDSNDSLDRQIRVIERVSDSAGAATGIVAGPTGLGIDFVGGRNSVAALNDPNYVSVGTALTTESWEVTALTGIYPDGTLGA